MEKNGDSYPSDEEWLADCIITHREDGNGNVSFRARWKGKAFL